MEVAPGDLAEEAADATIALLNYANARGIDLAAEVERKMSKIEDKAQTGIREGRLISVILVSPPVGLSSFSVLGSVRAFHVAGRNVGGPQLLAPGNHQNSHSCPSCRKAKGEKIDCLLKKTSCAAESGLLRWHGYPE